VLKRLRVATSVVVILLLAGSLLTAGCAGRARQALQQELADCEAEAQAAEAKAAEAEARVESLEAEIAAQESKIEELEAELESLKGGS
jgi:peptidoglycan hydrolase CwlO-like protein